MSWQSPRTWVTGEMETAAIFNVHLRDNLNALYATILPTAIPGMIVQYIYCTLGGSDGHRPVVSGEAQELWHVCNGDLDIDGSGINAPDWRGRFVVGAGSTYNPGDIGGTATKDVNHSHGTGTLETVNSPLANHVHLISGNSGGPSIIAGYSGALNAAGWNHTHSISTNSGNPTTSPNHNHAVSGVSNSGGPAALDVMPPYYALLPFILVEL